MIIPFDIYLFYHKTWVHVNVLFWEYLCELSSYLARGSKAYYVHKSNFLIYFIVVYEGEGNRPQYNQFQ